MQNTRENTGNDPDHKSIDQQLTKKITESRTVPKKVWQIDLQTYFSRAALCNLKKKFHEQIWVPAP